MEQQPSLEQIFGSYTAWEAKEGTWFLNFMNGSENMYLLEGADRALLIDTGYGAGNLRKFVEKLTDKPLVVVNTHFHPDHAAGNGEFEEVGMSGGWSLDAPSVTSSGAVPFDLTKLPCPGYKKVILKDGDTIDLGGGRVIEVWEVKPAHCNSSLFFLDRKERMLFTGDEYECQQTIMFDNSNNPDAPYDGKERLDNLKENALRILGEADAFDWVLPNHNGYPLTKSYVEAYVGLVDAIYAGTAVIEEKLNHPYIEMDPKARELCRVRFGRVSIFMKKEEVQKVYGK